MPPYALWLRGAADIGAWMLGPGAKCRGSRLRPTHANGAPAFGQYRVDPEGGYTPWGLQVLELSGGCVSTITIFLDPALFPAFGLPTHLDS
jgi:RNA polymerase sigma-70 factor (ECF subfamily)